MDRRWLMMRVKSRVEILEDEIGSLDDRVKVLETLNKELKSKYADNIVQIELLVQSMDDFERAMLKVIFSPFDSTGYRHGVGGWCKP